MVWNDIAYIPGQVCRIDDGVIPGPVSDATDPATIEIAARASVLRALGVLDRDVGLDRVARIIFLRCFVFAEVGYKRHSRVLDPASDLLVAVFGPSGEHARSAIGVAGLPEDGLLEIEIVAALLPSSRETASLLRNSPEAASAAPRRPDCAVAPEMGRPADPSGRESEGEGTAG